MDVEFGNAASRTHAYGQAAAKGISRAREQIASAVNGRPQEVVYTSGATEANNLAILGLRPLAEQSGKRHIITSAIEHKAVLEPLEYLENIGFDVEYVLPGVDGLIEPEEVLKRIRPDTLIVSLMHVNNESGAVQPIGEIAEALANTEVLFHTDAAQGFGKQNSTLKCKAIDLVTISGHKCHAPKGIGCLIVRQEKRALRKLSPIAYGGGQERGLRPGTLPTHLICGLGKAAELSDLELTQWTKIWRTRATEFKAILNALPSKILSPPAATLGNSLMFGIKGVPSEALILHLKAYVALSSGSACTSSSTETSHVLRAMNLDAEEIDEACRASWCHLTPKIPVDEVIEKIKELL
jgi:cysteine desulfurase